MNIFFKMTSFSYFSPLAILYDISSILLYQLANDIDMFYLWDHTSNYSFVIIINLCISADDCC